MIQWISWRTSSSSSSCPFPSEGNRAEHMYVKMKTSNTINQIVICPADTCRIIKWILSMNYVYKYNVLMYLINMMFCRYWWKRSIPLYSGNASHVSKVSHKNNLHHHIYLLGKSFSRLEQSFLRLFCLVFSHARFAAYKNWNFEVLNISKSESGGIKVNLNLWITWKHLL